MSAGNIDKLLNIWAELMENTGEDSPFKSHKDVYETIDAMHHDDALWRCLMVSYNGEATHNCPT
jgi:hypothetical protein